MNELYKQEVLELTDLLSNEENWSDLRDVLINKEFKLKEIALVSFMEDDEENEYGVIVTKNERIIKYVRSTSHKQKNINYFQYKDITDLKEEIDNYPQVQIAFEMIKKGEILND